MNPSVHIATQAALMSANNSHHGGGAPLPLWYLAVSAIVFLIGLSATVYTVSRDKNSRSLLNDVTFGAFISLFAALFWPFSLVLGAAYGAVLYIREKQNEDI
jgi:hypothetical protein